MSHFRIDIRQRAEEVLALYPRPRSAMLPLLHLAQEQDGYVSDAGIAEVAELTLTTPADVRGTALFYDMFHLEPVGKYVVGICTNIACLLAGGDELLEHASMSLGCPVGSRSNDGLFTLEETECLADCDVAPCVQVNHRYVRTTTPDAFDAMVAELRAGKLEHEVPNHGTLIRVRRTGGLHAPRAEVASERAAAHEQREARAQETK
jgi:NADH:ubiquinone oxidoreductase subunit E